LSAQNWLNSPGEAPPLPPADDPPEVPWTLLVDGVLAPPLVPPDVPVLGVVAGEVVAGVVVVAVDEVEVPAAVPPVALVDDDVLAAVDVVAVWSVDVVDVPLVDVPAGASSLAPAGTVSAGASLGMRSAVGWLPPQPAAPATVSAASETATTRGTRYGMGGD
jgi:hypothetical protein